MGSVVAGIDEVGYGPSLGPLVVCSYAFRVARPGSDLWETLHPAVTRRPGGEGLTVCDSKEAYSPDRGIGTLEPTALSFLSMLPHLPGRSLRGLIARLALQGERALEAPWYAGSDVSLPLSEGEIDGSATGLWQALQGAGVVPLACRAAWVEPAEFNREVRSTKNKADLLFERACGLVRSLLETAPAGDVAVAIGKQGGRRMYLPGLVREFGSVWVLEETPPTSRYEFRQGGRRVTLTFLRDGESRDFSIALASMIGKYLREGAMRLFNDYWRGHRADLKPTSGYGSDARRFFREIQDELNPLGIERDTVLRSR